MFFIASLIGIVGFVYLLFHVAMFAIVFKYLDHILIAFAIAVILATAWQAGNASY